MSILAAKAPAATPAKLMPPDARRRLALDALCGVPVCHLARAHHVSTRFVRRQRAIAAAALGRAFSPPPSPPQRVLFHLPVTKVWLEQLVLALLLIGHCSIRGAHEILRDVFGVHKSIGSICALAQQAACKAAAINARQDLSRVKAAALDEIFQNQKPVLAVVDVESTYCCLLGQEERRDGDTWGVRLLELRDQGFAPVSTVADGGTGLRKGVTQALPGVPCRADNWHALRDVGEAVRFLENRAYDAIKACDKLQRRLACVPADAQSRERAEAAQREQDRAIALADDVALLACWLRADVLALAGPPLGQRRERFDFVLAQLRERRPLCERRLGPVCSMLASQKENLLGFCEQLDEDVSSLAAYARVSREVVREMVAVQEMAETDGRRWRREGALRGQLGERYETLFGQVEVLRAGVARASSVVENVNSRVRNYLFLRKAVGGSYLELLRFFLNHRRFLRSEHAERVGKSPAELLSGQEHPHWLGMLGYQPFVRQTAQAA
jgi:hypothetical protein